MKFGKTFESHLTTEWREMYMNYANLDAMIRQAVFKAPDASVRRNTNITNEGLSTPQDPAVEAYYRQFEQDFFAVCHQELSRVEYFFAQKLAEARRKLGYIRIELTTSQHLHNTWKLGLFCSEYYLSLIMLQNFQSLNYTAFYKICKKYDKYIRSVKGGEWFQEYVRDAPFSQEDELLQMIRDVEDLYTVHLANGDRAKAMAKLRVPPLRRPSPPTQVFLAGMLLGLFVVSAIIVLLSFIYLSNWHGVTITFGRFYRGLYTWVLWCFYLAINVCVWRNVGINHVLIFELDMRKDVPPVAFLQVASGLGYICNMSTLMFLHYKEFGMAVPYHFPLICIGLVVLLLLNPIHVLNFKARMWLLRSIGRVLLAPLFHVNFADFWLGDELTSSAQCLVDMYQLFRFYFRYYLSRPNSFNFEHDFMTPVLLCLPSWYRFAQCVRRYYDSPDKPLSYPLNAFKYVSNFVVVILATILRIFNPSYSNLFANPWTWIYMVACSVSSIYGSAWDLFYDFGLFRVWKGENLFLRENLIYIKSFYYIVIVSNVLMRFIWVLELFLLHHNILSPYDCTTIVTTMEVTRRFIWNFIRLENEHLNNCGSFRATRDIHLETIDLDGDVPRKKLNLLRTKVE